MSRTSSFGRLSIEAFGGGEGLGGLEDRRETRCVALRPESPVSPPVQYSNIFVKGAASDRAESNDKSLAALISIIVLSPDIAD